MDGAELQQHTCRLCGYKGNDLSSVVGEDEENIHLRKMINIIIHVDMNMADNFPKHVCSPCIVQLQACSRILTSFGRAESNLKAYVANSRKNTIEESASTAEEFMNLKKWEPAVSRELSGLERCTGQAKEVGSLSDGSVRAGGTSQNETRSIGLSMEELFKIHSLDVKLPVKCDLCEKSFRKFKTFDKHMLSHEESTLYLCQFCSNSYVSWSNLVAHRKVCHKGKMLSCQDCSEKRAYTIKNITYPVEKFKYGCEECNEGFCSSNELYKHYKKHKENIFSSNQRIKPPKKQCPKCKYFFKSQEDLNQHTALVNNGYYYCCNICNEKFCNIQICILHKRKHLLASRINLCWQCGLVFPKKSALRKHRTIHANRKLYTCNICTKSFKREHSFEMHKYKHPISLQYKCIKCSVSLEEWTSYVEHFRHHSLEDKILCNICGRSKDSEEFLMHYKACHDTVLDQIDLMKTDKPRCNICQKSFSKLSSLQHHENLHKQGQRFCKCDICDRRFVKQERLAKHLEMHFPNAEYPKRYKALKGFVKTQFMCEYCGKFFPQGSYLNRHRKSHTSENPYECEVCAKKFRLEKNLVKHRKIHKHFLNSPS